MKPLKFISAATFAAGLYFQQFAAGQTYSENIQPTIGENSYNTAIGLRGGGTSGLTIKNFFAENKAFEGIIAIWPYAFGLTGLYEKHEPAFELEGMYWYYGVGAHATLGTGRAYYTYTNGDRTYYRFSSGSLGLGVDGILGLEYKIKAIPFAVSLDMKPFIEGNTEGGAFISLDPGLGIKVVF